MEEFPKQVGGSVSAIEDVIDGIFDGIPIGAVDEGPTRQKTIINVVYWPL